ncbi:hypothetical protein GA0116948_1327 [Chitinophaga costaii]|uniref:Uncharacterized protein n=1 Tax=Chitinophaga costaii TaxID=1335309 RepID=A0A1C4G9G7_9BACT|nr:hypothetical protein GA0116948_1327 [Chitinophaga costaii]
MTLGRSIEAAVFCCQNFLALRYAKEMCLLVVMPYLKLMLMMLASLEQAKEYLLQEHWDMSL